MTGGKVELDFGGRLERSALIEEICREKYRQVLIAAPSGYGKSELLSQCLQRLLDDGRVAYLRLEDRHRDTDEFVASLANSLNKGRGNEAAICSGWATILDAAANDDHVTIILDGIQFLDGSPAEAELYELIAATPRGMKIVVAGGSMPAMAMSRLRLSGSLLELDANDLRLSHHEITSLAKVHFGGSLSDSEIAEITRQSEGWPALVALMSQTIVEGRRHRETPPLAATTRKIGAFFAEIVAASSRESWAFLTFLAIFKKIEPSVCDALLSSRSSDAMIRQLIGAGFPIFREEMAQSCYRMHTLFGEYLLADLRASDPEGFAQLHRRAANSFLEQGDYAAAFEHLLEAGCDIDAAALLDEHWNAISVHVPAIATKATSLSTEARRKYPRIDLNVMIALTLDQDIEHADSLLSLSRERLDSLRKQQRSSSHEVAELEQKLHHREALLASYRDDLALVQHHYDQWDQEDFSIEARERLSLYVAMMSVYRERFQLGMIAPVERMARSTLSGLERPEGRILFDGAHGLVTLATGKANEAVEILEAAFQSANMSGVSGNIMGAIVFPLAEACCELNQFDRAREITGTYRSLLRAPICLDGFISGWLASSRLAARSEGTSAALDVLNEAADLAAARRIERSRIIIGAEQAGLLLQRGDNRDATRIAEQLGVSLSSPLPMPKMVSCTKDEARAFIWIGLARAREQTGDALQVIRRWRAFLERRQAFRALARWDLLFAELLCEEGRDFEAQRVVQRVVEYASKGSLLATVSNSESVLRPIFDRVEDFFMEDQAASGFLSEARAMAGVHSNPGDKETLDEVPIRKLSRTEASILRMAKDGLSNRQIGELIGMTEGSVKYYMQQIFAKLNVRRRIVAARKAENLNLI